MATIDLATRPGSSLGGHPQAKSAIRTPYIIGKEINLATAVTTKGSALAQGDVIEALDLPKYSVLLAGGAQCVTAMTGTSTDLTLDIGITGGDVDNIIDGWDFDAATAGPVASVVGVQEPVFIGSTADTLDILFVTQTGTVLTGKIWVWALIGDIKPTDNPGLAALKS